MGSAFAEGSERDAQLEAIFRAQFADLYRYIYRQVRNALVAEDLTSTVFLKALRWLQGNRRPESVKGWLYATARSEIADYWREQGRLDLLPLEAAEDTPALAEVNDEQMRPLQERIQRLLDGLSERERAVLTLRYFQGYSATEIGQALGLSTNHVRVLQLRALRRAAFLEVEERSVLWKHQICHILSRHSMYWNWRKRRLMPSIIPGLGPNICCSASLKREVPRQI